MESLRIYLPDELDKAFRKMAMEQFGYAKGSISLAAEAAISRWVSQGSYINSQLEEMEERARKDPNILAVFLFGSYARNELNYNDVDIAILLENDNVNSTEFLPQYTDEKELFDVSIMNRLPLVIQMRIFTEGKILYCKDKGKVYDFYFKVLEEWEDFKPTREYLLSKRVYGG